MSDVEICNDALGYIGKADINSLRDPEPAARQCRKFLPRTLREMQARYDWEHNLKVSDVSAKTTVSDMPGYRYAHKLPAGYIRFSALCVVEDSDTSTWGATFTPATGSDGRADVVQLKDAAHRSPPIPFRIADGVIHTNFTPIRLVYHYSRTDTTDLPELFRAALVAQLAAKLVFPLTRDTKLAADIRETAAQALMFAQDNEDKDELNEAPQGSSFQDARR